MTDLRGIQRYDIEFTAQASHSEYRDMVEGELGDWVKYDDVAEALSSSEALNITLEDLGKKYMLPMIECPAEDGPHSGGPADYVLVAHGIHSRPIHPCVGHLNEYLRCGWFARKLVERG